MFIVLFIFFYLQNKGSILVGFMPFLELVRYIQLVLMAWRIIYPLRRKSIRIGFESPTVITNNTTSLLELSPLENQSRQIQQAKKIDLMRLIHDYFGQFGIDFNQFLTKQWRSGAKFLLLILYLDLIYSIFLMVMPVNQNDSVIYVGDISALIFPARLHTAGNLVAINFRLYLLLLWHLFAWDNYGWLRESNRLFHQAHFLYLTPRLYWKMQRVKPLIQLFLLSIFVVNLGDFSNKFANLLYINE